MSNVTDMREELQNQKVRFWTFRHAPGEGTNTDDALPFVQEGLKHCYCSMQYEYEFQNPNMVTQHWDVVTQNGPAPGDVIFMRGTDYVYAVGRVILPRILNGDHETVPLRKGYGGGENGEFSSSGTSNGNVRRICLEANGEIIPLYLELDGEQNWGQRIDVDKWRYVCGDGVYARSDWLYVDGSSRRLCLRELKRDSAFELIEKLFKNYKEKNKMVVELVETLETCKNLVFTGAPGTGKTFLAWQIASAMTGDVNPMEKGCEDEPHPHIGFCQFHPSMDYADFVEGLRPTVSGNGQVGFELQDGIFKDFCRRAALGVSSNYEEVWERFIDDVARTNSRDNPLELKTPQGKKFRVFANSNGNLSLMTGEGAEVQGSLTKEKVASFLSETPYEFWGGYYRGVLAHLKEDPYNLRWGQENSDQKFVFIIDEINRGDIAKIFGELFFAIDPGYRGGKGRIETQYGNLIPPGDSFKRFYVPDNVYIIGTMNDIDRGVESMDFAIRRRFTWKDVKPEETQEAILRSKIKNDELFAKVKNRMDNLNAAISAKDSGLGSAYCIGGAYFTHVKVSEDGSTADFDSLWDFHLEPLLREYLRGQEQEVVDKQMEEFKKKFNDETPPASQPQSEE